MVRKTQRPNRARYSREAPCPTGRVRPSGHNRMHNLPPQKRRGNKAVRNRSLLTAAGWTMIDRTHECG